MARFIIEDFHKDALDALTPGLMREVRRKCLWAGAKVAEKEMRKVIDDSHHISGDMGRSVSQGPMVEDVDGAWVEVYPQGYDSRGVSNEMKNKLINNGSRRNKKDPYVRKMRKMLEPRIRAVMEYQFELCMKEINGG